MVNVTQRIRQVTQPRGGYVPARSMEVLHPGPVGLDSAPIPLEGENVPYSLVAMAVDYLTRVSVGIAAVDAFRVSLWGARIVGGQEELDAALELCKVIDGSRDRVLALPGDASARFAAANVANPRWAEDRQVYFVPDAAAIAAALKLTSYDSAYRAGLTWYNPNVDTDPDDTTLEHISSMIGRSLYFMWEYGPLLVDGFTMFGGYTATVDGGEGDFVTRDTMWDFKVSVKPPTPMQTLQLLMYWLMARRSEWCWHPSWNLERMPESEWREIWDLEATLRDQRAWPRDLRGPVPTHIGIYNPRSNTAYRLDVATIAPDVLAAVERDVIGYDAA